MAPYLQRSFQPNALQAFLKHTPEFIPLLHASIVRRFLMASGAYDFYSVTIPDNKLRCSSQPKNTANFPLPTR